MTDTPHTTVSAVMKMGAADVLDTIANLSNDEVFTPPKLANQVLDLLPDHIWSDRSLKFLDPCVKTGVFLREIVKRLMVGLQDEIEDEAERREHILRNQIYGIAITELTALMSRRTVYCSSDATRLKNDEMPENCYSAVIFEKSEGNIAFPSVGHTWAQKKKGVIAQSARCEVCGAKYSDFTGDDRVGMESYAYPFIHMDIQEIFGEMKFDVVVGNPPYQIADGGHGSSASPIYQKFVSKARDLDPQYISMIIPARWYAGGKGLDDFRKSMLQEGKVSHLVDVLDSGECFPGVRVNGGICYFKMEKNFSGPAVIENLRDGKTTSRDIRHMSEFDVFVRDNMSVSIIRKVQLKSNDYCCKLASSHKPFGLRSFFKDYATTKENPEQLKVHVRGGSGWVEPHMVKAGVDMINNYKVLIGKAYGEEGQYPYWVLGKPFIAGPKEVCTETYIVAASFSEEHEAKNFTTYMKTRFFRFMASINKPSQNISRNTFSNVPIMDMSEKWTDSRLFEYFQLASPEIEFIKSSIKEMP